MSAALIAKLESASEGSRGLDAELAVISKWPPLGRIKHWVHDEEMEVRKHGNIGFKNIPDNDAEWSSPPVTTSLDSALEMVMRVLPGCRPGVSQNAHSGSWFAWLGYVEDGAALLHAQNHGNTPALAICAALLRASAAEGADRG